MPRPFLEPILAKRFPAHLTLLLIGLMASNSLLAQTPASGNSWEVMRIFVAERDIGSMVPRDYSPVLMETFTKDLQRESERRRQAELDAPHIEDALYVVRLQNGSLVSDNSKWSIQSNRPNASFSLEGCTLSLRAPVIQNADQQSLISSLRFSSDGSASIAGIKGNSDFWFGFSAAPTRQVVNQSTFQLSLPKSTISRMILSVPDNVQVSSTDVNVRRIEGPMPFVPDGWPSSTSTPPGSHWYFLNLSGLGKFSLTATVTEKKDFASHNYFIRRSNLAYVVDPGGVRLNADFEFGQPTAATELSLKIDKSLKLRAAWFNDVPLPWKLESSSDPLMNMVGISTHESPAVGAVLRLEAFVESTLPAELSLPGLSIDKAFIWEGRTALQSQAGLEVSDFRIASNDTRLPTSLTTGATNWQCDWTGSPPPLHAQFKASRNKWTANTFTRLLLQNDSLAATTNARLFCNNLNSNELRINVGDGWFVDDISIGQSDIPVQLRLPDDKISDIVLSWENATETIRIDIQVTAHRPRDAEADVYSMDAPSLIHIKDAEQVDVYGIEQTSGYQIEPDTQLQRLKIANSELPSWQANLLARLSDAAVYKGKNGAIPPLVLKRSEGTYSSDIKVIVQKETQHVRVIFLVDILPNSSAIDQINFLLNMPKSLIDSDKQPTWYSVQDHVTSPLKAVPVKANSNGKDTSLSRDGEVLYEIELPEPTTSKLSLRYEQLILVENDEIILPLISTPSSSSTVNTLVIPRRFSIDTAVGLEALPGGACCVSTDVADSIGGMEETMAAYHYDPSIVSAVQLKTAQTSFAKNAWAWSQHTDHRFSNGGRILHQCNWSIFSAVADTHVINLPTDWSVDRCLVNNEAMDIHRSSNSTEFVVNLPAGERVHLSLKCSSHTRASMLVNHLDLQSPKLAIETLDQSSTLWLPPGKVSVDAMFANPPAKLLSVLLPRNYWSWLTPMQPNSKGIIQLIDGRDEGNLGWSRIELTSPQLFDGNEWINRTRIADQPTIAAIFIASILLLTAFWMMILRSYLPAWLLVLPLLILLVLFVDSTYAILGQALLLAYAIAAMAKLVGYLTFGSSRNSFLSSQRGSTVLNRDLVKVGSVFLLSTAVSGQLYGQPYNGLSNTSPTIFGVIIPINDEKVVSAGHAYVPNKLIKILENSSPLEAENREPQILGAKYLLRLRGGTGTAESYVQEFTVEFELAFPGNGMSIRLPFKSSQVQLLRGLEDGQAVSIGSQVLKTNDAIVYRPSEVAPTTVLRLQLIPTVTAVGDRSFIEMSIPKVATATLDVTSDEALDVQVAGLGETRRTTVSNLQKSDLGPTDTLKVSWPTRATRLSASNPAQIQSDTLIHFRENQLLAECQIRVNGANSLPKQLNLVVDAGWEPIGDIWNDGRLISSELAATGNRRMYTVARPDSKDNIAIRVLMVPRNMSTISAASLPFISFKEGAFISGAFPNRTLSIDSDRRPGWKLSGADQWSQLKGSGADLQWDAVLNAPSPTILKVPSGPINATIQRISNPSQTHMVREDSVLELSRETTQLIYRVEWLPPSNEVAVIRVDIPANATPTSVTLDGNETKYLISNKAGTHQLTIARDSKTNLRRMDIRFRLPTSMNSPSSLPRAMIQDSQATTSTYRVNSSADLACSLSAEPETNLQFIQPATAPSELMRSFTYCVGQADLTNGFRDSVSLPVRYELTERENVPPKSNLMQLTRSEQGWRAKVEVVFESSIHSADFVFFDVPANFRELMEPNGIPYSISAESAGRSTLCIASQSPNKLTRVAFNFRLPSLGSSQSIAIPDIQLLGKSSQRPVLALPTQIDRQPVRWTRAGRRLSDEWASQQNIGLASGEFVYFELDGQQQQTTWSPVEIESKSPELLNAIASLTDRGGGNVAGVMDYWIEPNANLELTGQVPSGCELVGVRTGSLNAVWNLEDARKLRILMQPSFLPVRVRLYVKWKLSITKPNVHPDTDEISLPVPRLDVANFRQLHVAIQSVNEIQKLALHNPTSSTGLEESPRQATTIDGQSTSFSIASRALAQAWKKLLMKAPPVATNTGELTSWIKDWSFSNIGLSGQYVMPRSTTDPETLRDQTVAEFWRWYVGRFDEGVAQVIDDAVPNENLDDEEVEQMLHISSSGDRRLPIRWFMIENPNQDLRHGNLILSRTVAEDDLGQRIWASVAIFGFSIVGYWFAPRLRRTALDFVATNPWIYWMLLAALVWLIVPVVWPSVVILGCSVGMLLSQFAANRKRALAYRR
jgi:hypothetical protein